MSRIFISYRHDDTAGWAVIMNERLADRFGADKIFMDIDGIAPGDDFVEVIRNKVSACEVLLVLIGRAWLTVTDDGGRRRLDNHDDFVRLEVKAALDRGIRVIPVLLSGARPPKPEEVPAELSPLCQRNAIVVTDVGYRQDISRLIDVVEKAIGPLDQPKPANPAASTKTQTKRRRVEVDRSARAPKEKPPKIVGATRIFRDHGKPVKAVAFSPDNAVLASAGGGSWVGGGDTAIRLWRVSDGRLTRTMEGHPKTVTRIAFSPDGDLLASRCSTAFYLWRTSTGKRVRTLDVDTQHDAFAFSADGERLVTWSDDQAEPASGPFDLWLVANGKKHGSYSRGRLPGKGHFMWNHVSRDGKLTTSVQKITEEDQNYPAIVVKRAAGGTTLHELNEDGMGINDWTFSADNRFIAAAYLVGNVRVWRVADGACVATMDGEEPLNGVAISPDGRWIAAACEDKLVRVWSFTPPPATDG